MLADLDEDGDIDLLAVNPYGCRAYDVATGNDLSGWPQYFSFNWTYFLGASPAVGDIDGDGHLEV
ncbi:MAG: VCBS repeat-containing protein, partial [Prochlorococcaceae cyanobacterium]